MQSASRTGDVVYTPGQSGDRARAPIGGSPLRELCDAVMDRLSAGAIAGLSAGLVILVASMGWAVHDGKPAAAPLAAAATIFNVAPKPTPTPDNLVIGLITHLTLTVLFGIGFVALIVTVRRLGLAPEWKTSLAWAIGYGLVLYLVNFQILGRTTFPVFSHMPTGDQEFNIVKHAVFALLLLPFIPSRGIAHRGAPLDDPAV
jgi:hypothetical protein